MTVVISAWAELGNAKGETRGMNCYYPGVKEEKSTPGERNSLCNNFELKKGVKRRPVS